MTLFLGFGVQIRGNEGDAISRGLEPLGITFLEKHVKHRFWGWPPGVPPIRARKNEFPSTNFN